MSRQASDSIYDTTRTEANTLIFILP